MSPGARDAEIASAITKDFFITYNSADRSWAEWIAWQLEEVGYTTVIQAWDFRPGSNFVLEIQRAASEARRTIVVLSPDYVIALYSRPEWAPAFAQDPDRTESWLLPICVRECELKGPLRNIVYTNLVGMDEKVARQALLTGVIRERAKPATPLHFPIDPQHHQASQHRFPGSLSQVWNVLQRRNPSFVGRNDLLKKLRTVLVEGAAAALTGLSGVGKTQVAVEYTYMHAVDYNIVWWLRADESGVLASDYAGLAVELGLWQQPEVNLTASAQAVRLWLEQHANWLLVFDNASDLTSIRSYLPREVTGHVVITSRNPDWRSCAEVITVPVLTRAEAVDLLLAQTGQADEMSAASLAGMLGDLPIALRQASAYIETSGISFAKYLELFEPHYQSLLESSAILDYPTAVSAAWDTSFQQIQQISQTALDLLNLCSFLASHDIPRDLVTKGLHYLPETLAALAADHAIFDDTVVILRSYFFLEADDDSLSINRLVQIALRDRLSADTKTLWATTAVQLLNAAFVFNQDDAQTWSVCSRLLPHALQAVSHAETLRADPEATSELLNRIGLYFNGRAEFVEAQQILERALTIAEATHGPIHPSLAVIVNNLGNAQQELGDLEAARMYYERALTIAEATHGPIHPNVVPIITNLGYIQEQRGNVEEARMYYERGLKIAEAIYDSAHPDVATIVANLGRLCQQLGNVQRAQVYYERALEIDEAALGPNHPQIAVDAVNLAGTLERQGAPTQALVLYERALAIYETTYGSHRPEIGTIVSDIDRIRNRQGQTESVQAYLEYGHHVFSRTSNPRSTLLGLSTPNS